MPQADRPEPDRHVRRLAGYKDVDDTERICVDHAMRTVIGGQARDAKATSTCEMARFETKTLNTNWTTLREKPIKIGAKVASHAKSVLFQLAKVVLPWRLFAAILNRIGRSRLAGGSG